ncbi:MAG: NAD(P)H-dependent glycerol-3-phosphate dehydrogenase, partial [Gallionellaceae bacterium]|nr:NAD(P)H-dependent glycerol-3-phosphate dehydrogenase [Gallionellaceae bacterium]
MNITILGAGAWGTALAISLSARHKITLWARDAAQIETMRSRRVNQRYLPDIPLPPQINLTADIQVAHNNVELILLAVPIAALRMTLQNIAQLPAAVPVILACKGFETDSAQLPHQVIAETLPQKFPYAILSGPSFAQEVARGLPTALTLAANDSEFATQMAHSLHHARLRIYSSTDVVGVEVGGAVKNV